VGRYCWVRADGQPLNRATFPSREAALRELHRFLADAPEQAGRATRVEPASEDER